MELRHSSAGEGVSQGSMKLRQNSAVGVLHGTVELRHSSAVGVLQGPVELRHSSAVGNGISQPKLVTVEKDIRKEYSGQFSMRTQGSTKGKGIRLKICGKSQITRKKTEAHVTV